MRLAYTVGGAAWILAVSLLFWRASDGTAAPAPAKGARTPLVLELFTSEGCSSCPPADALLAKLAAEQPFPGVELIPIELHVDYWNDLGWTDPFSSPIYSERQAGYAGARSLAAGRVYTPQLVVGGRAELVGSDAKRVRATIEKTAATAATAATAVTVPLSIRVTRHAKKPALDVTIDVGPRAAAGDVYVVVTESGLVTEVARGENAGRRLAHAPVARWLTRAGAVAASDKPTTVTATVPLAAAWKPGALRVVAFLQAPGPGAIVAAAAAPVP